MKTLIVIATAMGVIAATSVRAQALTGTGYINLNGDITFTPSATLGTAPVFLWWPGNGVIRVGKLSGATPSSFSANSIVIGAVSANPAGAGSITIGAGYAAGDVACSIGGGFASGYQSVTVGNGGFAQGQYSVAIGPWGTASGAGSIAISGGSATGDSSFAAIAGSASGEGSVALAAGVAPAYLSSASGEATAPAIGGTAFGIDDLAKMKDGTSTPSLTQPSSDDPIFEIGNASDGTFVAATSNSNALTVFRDGTTVIGGTAGIANHAPAASLIIPGSVGIGRGTASDAKLAVEGRIRAREVIVDTATWSDDVFDPIYRVAPLQEVEQTIKAQHHLPGIPSAADVAAHGVNIGDMQARLLAKIEELTLRQIEQDKLLRQQAAIIQQQGARIAALEQNDPRSDAP